MIIRPTPPEMQRRATALAASAMIATLTACASVPVPTAEMAAAEAAVARAGTQATRESAPTELRLATEKLAQARSATAAGDQDRARRLAVQVALDAQVAELHAQAVRSRKAAEESEDATRALRDEINRKTVR
jgi:Domain of unknown function (DUF4398)